MLYQIALLGLMTVGLSGCIIIPTPPHGGDHIITEEMIASLELGKTTRSDILLRLGDPVERLHDDRFFAYRWTQTHGYILVGSYVSGAVGRIPAGHYLGLEFTSDNRLKQAKVFHPWVPLTDKRDSFEEWAAEQLKSPQP